VTLTPHSHQQINHKDKKINKETSALNSFISQMDLTDICRIPHSTAEEYTFFSTDHGTFSKTDHILGYKARLNK
jgi:exonuclease III